MRVSSSLGHPYIIQLAAIYERMLQARPRAPPIRGPNIDPYPPLPPKAKHRLVILRCGDVSCGAAPHRATRAVRRRRFTRERRRAAERV